MLEVFAWLEDTPLQLPNNPSKQECHSCLVRVKLEYNLYSQRGGSSSDRSRRCWLLAALIYLHTIIATPSGWSLLPKMEAHLIEELRELLEERGGESSETRFDADVHLWILVFGGVHAREHDATWYQSAMKRFCEAGNLRQWEDVKSSTKNLPWVHDDVEETLKDFWKDCTIGD